MPVVYLSSVALPWSGPGSHVPNDSHVLSALNGYVGAVCQAADQGPDFGKPRRSCREECGHYGGTNGSRRGRIKPGKFKCLYEYLEMCVSTNCTGCECCGPPYYSPRNFLCLRVAP